METRKATPLNMENLPGPLNTVSLFCGKDHFTKVARSLGHNVFSTDKRKRKNTCEPTLQIPFQKLSRALIPFDKVHVLWCAFPCTAFSYAAGNFYYKDGIPNARALPFIDMLKKCLALIKEIAPDFYFIENPRGRMRYEKCMIDFIAKTHGSIKEITLGSYGLSSQKPTDIITNCHQWITAERLPYGRGNKSIGAGVYNKTQCQAQETPEPLFTELFQILHKLYML